MNGNSIPATWADFEGFTTFREAWADALMHDEENDEHFPAIVGFGAALWVVAFVGDLCTADYAAIKRLILAHPHGYSDWLSVTVTAANGFDWSRHRSDIDPAAALQRFLGAYLMATVWLRTEGPMVSAAPATWPPFGFGQKP